MQPRGRNLEKGKGILHQPLPAKILGRFAMGQYIPILGKTAPFECTDQAIGRDLIYDHKPRIGTNRCPLDT